MARLPYLDKKDLAPENQDLLDRPINLNRVLVHSPNCRRAGLALANFIRHTSKLDARLRELAILQVGYLARAPYEWSHHIKIGHNFGVSEDDVRELMKAAEGQPANFDELTTLVLSAAREMTVDGGMSAATFAALKAKLGEEQLIDLIVTIGHYNGIVRVLASLEVDVEPEYQPYLDKFPLPA
jgi:alkylhydroperoxidase family enzyme